MSRSLLDAEYRAMTVATSELVWLLALLKDLTVEHPQPMQLFCNNQVALHVATNHVFHKK